MGRRPDPGARYRRAAELLQTMSPRDAAAVLGVPVHNVSVLANMARIRGIPVPDGRRFGGVTDSDRLAEMGRAGGLARTLNKQEESMQYSLETNQEIMRLSRDGLSSEDIAARTGVSRSHVFYVRKRHRTDGERFKAPPRPENPARTPQIPWYHVENEIVDAHLDMTGERCHCGLRVDADHQPETCDLRGGAAGLAEKRRGHWSDLQGEDYHW